MKLISSSQEKLQSYVIENMIGYKQLIRDCFEDKDIEQLFIDFMIEKKYKQAFQLCCDCFQVISSVPMIDTLLNYFKPNVNKNWAKYHIMEDTNQLTNEHITLYDELYVYTIKQASSLPDIIFD